VLLAVIARILYIRSCGTFCNAAVRSAPQFRLKSPTDVRRKWREDSSIDIREINHELDGT
jgi:hypothetical protein